MRNPWSVVALLVGAFVFAFGGNLVADSLTGQPAVVGETGAQGPAGADGADGLDGRDGVNGVDGVDGALGPRGLPGAAGAPGADGAPGPTGATGNPGADGGVGLQGPTGPAGAAGADGPRSYAVIVNNPPAVIATTGTLAEVTIPEGTWIVSAGWQYMTLNPNTGTNAYMCYLTHSENAYLYEMANSGPAVNSYSMTQVFAVPAAGSTMRLACFAGSGVSVTFGQVTLSAIEVTN